MAVKHGQSYEELLELIRDSGRDFNMGADRQGLSAGKRSS